MQYHTIILYYRTGFEPTRDKRKFAQVDRAAAVPLGHKTIHMTQVWYTGVYAAYRCILNNKTQCTSYNNGLDYLHMKIEVQAAGSY
jgi:hypothetical protein